ncbi:hypothetical protein I317_04499 [Kwoniella heveanensis CBS 569]|nr:hypothetical protein I317_04499 [Kwoniella heveanensis CBS 569]
MSKRPSDHLRLPSHRKTTKESSVTPTRQRSGATTPGSNDFDFDAFLAAKHTASDEEDAGTIDWSTFGQEDTADTAVTQASTAAGGTAADDADLAWFSSAYGDPSGTTMPALQSSAEQQPSSLGIPPSQGRTTTITSLLPSPYPPKSRLNTEIQEMLERTEDIIRSLNKPGGTHTICERHSMSGCPTDPRYRSAKCEMVPAQKANIRYLEALQTAASSYGPARVLPLELLSEIDEKFSTQFNENVNERDINKSKLPGQLLHFMNKQKQKVTRYVESGGTYPDAPKVLLNSIVGDSLASQAAGNTSSAA